MIYKRQCYARNSISKRFRPQINRHRYCIADVHFPKQAIAKCVSYYCRAPGQYVKQCHLAAIFKLNSRLFSPEICFYYGTYIHPERSSDSKFCSESETHADNSIRYCTDIYSQSVTSIYSNLPVLYLRNLTRFLATKRLFFFI